MAIWVQFPELSMEYYDKVTFQQIEYIIWKPIKIDVYIGSINRAQFARVCTK
ncbi:hypothetical protein REPUB_Repub01dG0185500 [Reevesia pubescens]